jgi:hypothetical protein
MVLLKMMAPPPPKRPAARAAITIVYPAFHLIDATDSPDQQPLRSSSHHSIRLGIFLAGRTLNNWTVMVNGN